MNPTTGARTCVVMAALLLPTAAPAHEVVVEQIVRIDMQVQGDRLVVGIHVPATALGDARLPRLADGTLDRATIDGVLPIVTADVVRNLDLRQDGTALRASSAASRVGGDRLSIDIEATYRIDGAAGLSARLNAFRSEPLQPVRTIVRFVPASGAAPIISVVGPPVRVSFDPALADALQDFLARGLTTVLAFGDHLLMLVCLLVPARSTRDAVRVMMTMIAAQAVGMTIGVAGSNALGPVLPAAAMIAASVVVVAAVQNIVRVRPGFVAASAVGFGALNGLAFGRAFAIEAQLAGAHALGAFGVFLAVVAAAELWLGAVVAATRAWLDGRGVAERIMTPVASALIAHAAVHHVLDRGADVARSGSFAAEHAVVALTLGWAAVMVAIAVYEALRLGRQHGGAEPVVRSTGL
jgi:hypothetical protein